MKKVLLILIIISTITPVIIVGVAKTTLTVACEELSQVNTGGAAAVVTIVDNYAYVCDISDNNAGLVIFDITDLTNPVLLNRYYNDGWPQDVVVHDHIAYLADMNDGLKILNVSDPSNPIKLGSFIMDNMYTISVCVVGETAYIGDLHHGLIEINVANLSTPVHVRSVSSFSCSGVDISSDFLVAINHQEYYSGIEIRSLTDLTRIGRYMHLDTDFIFPIISNDLVIATNHHQDTGEIQIINISDPYNPDVISEFHGASVAQRCFVDGDLLYVTCSDAGIEVVDISDPAQPRKIGSYSDESGVSFDVSVKNSIMYVADGDDGLEIIQLVFQTHTIETSGFPILTS